MHVQSHEHFKGGQVHIHFCTFKTPSRVACRDNLKARWPLQWQLYIANLGEIESYPYKCSVEVRNVVR